ncbi:ROK family protein [Yinghuangia soli]|uniref:ROK family protein n=1 Tax=Yinghuangia soli TaxID=2908204 RepID=A0AA41Q153_9ACTN|nr:ROK family protein [Yinghuangia soli]MCF2529391.1 ROK family protein [Yinghuangia soli]
MGGTIIKGGLVAPGGTFLHTERRATGREGGPEAVTERIVGFADDLRRTAVELGLTPRAAGVVVPGIVDAEGGVAVWSANLRWRDLPLRRLVSERIGLPVAFDHDVRAGGLAEGRMGAAKDCANFLFLPLGTGVAGAFVMDGKPYAGAQGRAGEIGHIVVRPGGAPCGCGARGCLEAEMSGPAVARRYAEAVPGAHATAAEVVARVGAGDPVAAAVWHDAIEVLADGLLIALALFDTQLIVIGGGLSRAGETLIGPLREQLAERATVQFVPRIESAALGDDAGCHGAALLAWDALEAAR